jgi:hypothetical protein
MTRSNGIFAMVTVYKKQGCLCVHNSLFGSRRLLLLTTGFGKMGIQHFCLCIGLNHLHPVFVASFLLGSVIQFGEVR